MCKNNSINCIKAAIKNQFKKSKFFFKMVQKLFQTFTNRSKTLHFFFLNCRKFLIILKTKYL